MKQANRMIVIAVGLTSLALAGCSRNLQGFKPRTHLLSRAMPTDMKEQQHLRVSIEEFVSATKARKLFDANVARDGVLAFFVAVKNESTKDYKLWRRQIKVTHRGEPLKSIPAYIAAEKAHSPGVFWYGVAGLALLPTGFGMRPTTIDLVDNKIKEYFEELELADSILRPGESQCGFIYLEAPGGWTGSDTLAPMTVQLTLEQDKHGDFAAPPLVFELSVPALEVS